MQWQTLTSHTPAFTNIWLCLNMAVRLLLLWFWGLLSLFPVLLWKFTLLICYVLFHFLPLSSLLPVLCITSVSLVNLFLMFLGGVFSLFQLSGCLHLFHSAAFLMLCFSPVFLPVFLVSSHFVPRPVLVFLLCSWICLSLVLVFFFFVQLYSYFMLHYWCFPAFRSKYCICQALHWQVQK